MAISSICDFKEIFLRQGFATISHIYTNEEVENLLFTISQVDHSKPTFRKTTDLFAIRQFFKEVPAAVKTVFNNKLIELITSLFGDEYFVVKSIYFDKPGASNWFVSYHQDLTISVDKKIPVDGFGPWTTKHNQFAVQPPLQILQDNFTIRIHLDDTAEANGALRVVPGSHQKGIYRAETIDWTVENEVLCSVPRGGVMIMKPLLLHSSGRTTNNDKRRVIHIEFSRTRLPEPLHWAEFLEVGLRRYSLRL
jgi:ectoine hydroxylase-related dioxygenase (phytanoyl-CoA dioxygenase family)